MALEKTGRRTGKTGENTGACRRIAWSYRHPHKQSPAAERRRAHTSETRISAIAHPSAERTSKSAPVIPARLPKKPANTRWSRWPCAGSGHSPGLGLARLLPGLATLARRGQRVLLRLTPVEPPELVAGDRIGELGCRAVRPRPAGNDRAGLLPVRRRLGGGAGRHLGLPLLPPAQSAGEHDRARQRD